MKGDKETSGIMGVWGQDCGWFAVAVSTRALFGVDLKGNEGRIGDGCLQFTAGFRGAVRDIGGLGQALGAVLRL